MTELTAAQASSGWLTVVDSQGCIWLNMEKGWSYISEHTGISWDYHETLPELYEPYTGLDDAAHEFIRHALVALRQAELPD
jgi:hypothetical protein